MQKLDFETQKLDLPAFQGSDGDQNYVEKESLDLCIEYGFGFSQNGHAR